jgi:hypothetical protein
MIATVVDDFDPASRSVLQAASCCQERWINSRIVITHRETPTTTSSSI